jgi:hypothetical protein
MNNGFLRRLERLEGVVYRKPELRVFVGPGEDEGQKIAEAAAVYGLTPDQCELEMVWKMVLPE